MDYIRINISFQVKEFYSAGSEALENAASKFGRNVYEKCFSKILLAGLLKTGDVL